MDTMLGRSAFGSADNDICRTSTKAYGRFADLYDTLMADVDYDVWAEYMRSIIGHRKHVLECACGTGQITTRLASFYEELVAGDISDDMLSVAADTLRSAGKRARLIHLDMRKIAGFDNRFDAVIAACDAVNYLTSEDDVRLFLSGAFKALKQNGVLTFDISSEYKLSTIIGDNTFAEDNDSCAFIWQNDWNADLKLQTMDLTFFKQHGKLYECFRETHVQRGHSESELKKWLSQCGFSNIIVYEAFSHKAPFDNSERLQFVAHKN